jgi:arylsulfatase
MEEVFQFVATFKDFPPRSFPPSFNPANIMESTLDAIKRRDAFKENLDLDKVRGALNKMILETVNQGAQ